MTTRYSIIIPVYNRPGELKELLQSLQDVTKKSDNASNNITTTMTGNIDSHKTGSILKDSSSKKSTPAFNIEVIVVEDGSRNRSDEICARYTDSLNLIYLEQKNSGPSVARNTGARYASGEWLLFLDSDCMIPDGYFDSITSAIDENTCDFFGGPDRASSEFSALQKAIDYAMTSFITTGGIRGGKRKLDRYYPRSFNMGIKKGAFEDVGGFSGLRFGEDLDLSMRLMSAGYCSLFIENAWVYHKRRTNLKKFFKQVYNSGMARVVLQQLHPGTMKPVHLLPSAFVLYMMGAILSLPFFSPVLWYPPVILVAIFVIDGIVKTGNLPATLLIPAASLVQLSGYGTGLIHAVILIHVLGKKEARAFEDTFYK